MMVKIKVACLILHENAWYKPTDFTPNLCGICESLHISFFYIYNKVK